jgi:uncharacterized phage infection (PIP) family protein YhgE
MMDNEILQSLIGHFVVLKDKINGVKEELKTEIIAGQEELRMDVSAVTFGQEQLKTDIGAVTAGQEQLKADISAFETKINAGQEELRQGIKAFQERIRNIEAGQAAFEERVTRTVDARLKNVSSMVVQQSRNLRDALSRNIEAPDKTLRRSWRP